jgi:geranyl-CoA carboxylase alpha subunit
MPAISKLLVANRGEIACRVISTARANGYRTVAIYSEADTDALHVRLADESVLIGPGPAMQSYLNIERIIAAAHRTGADALHPGYGFLSERAAFAEACATAGLTFVGPDPEAIRIMGDKAESKRRMVEADVPCVPGYLGEDQADSAFVREAERIGYPIMVKASAGGGGRGMRLVHEAPALLAALQTARSEAQAAFGDGRLLLERALVEPRHVEIQVFGDRHGNVIHLCERDCSVQRRHQKVVEEAPSPAVSAQLRTRMGKAAVRAAATIGYVGAGTVEFLLTPDGSFYFLEMNTRLQVEHPVTEMVTGLDLIALQLTVAEGKPLPISQEAVTLSGHAMEVRLYAEDPANDFLPQTGNIAVWEPAHGKGVRIDHGLRVGAKVSPFYDPLLAKLIAWGVDRDEARRRLLRCVEDSRVFGVATNRAFLAATLRNPEFAAGEATTGFIARQFPTGFAESSPPVWVAALAAALFADRQGSGWRSNRWSSHLIKLAADFAGETQWYATRRETKWELSSADTVFSIQLLHRAAANIAVLIDGHRMSLGVHVELVEIPRVQLDLNGAIYTFEDRSLARPAAAQDARSGGALRAPMNGVVTQVIVAIGEPVKRGQPLLVLEAMKMEHSILAPINGLVELIVVAKGAQVATRDTLIVITAEPAA